MKKLFLLLVLSLISNFGSTQTLNVKGTRSGILGLGVRNTFSVFNDHDYGNNGFGYGGQFRIQFADRVNSDWYLDYITGTIDNRISRTDYHIGWSVLFYPTEIPTAKLKPYILAGHCFDRTELFELGNEENKIKKGSSAIQTGAGVHWNLTERLDLSLTGQYMFHLGEDVHAHIHDDEVHFERMKGAGLEGHFLFNVSINYKIADLW